MKANGAECRVSAAQTGKAVSALMQHERVQQAQQQKEQKQGGGGSQLLDLVDAEKYFWLIISTHTLSARTKVAPVAIELKHKLLPDDAAVCLFTKDPQKEFKERLHAQGLTRIKVIGVTKLRQKYKPYEAKRQLCASYDAFLADTRILPLLPKLLGKVFFAKKKLPTPVSLAGGARKPNDNECADKWADAIERALSSTSLYVSDGGCSAVKVGRLDCSGSSVDEDCSSTEQIVANVMHALPQIVAKIPCGWPNIKSIHIKASTSLALPLYTNAVSPTVSDGAVAADDTTASTAKKEEPVEEVVDPVLKQKHADQSFMRRVMKKINLKV